MSNLLYITNIGGKRMSYNFVGSAIEAAHELNLNFYSACNRLQSTSEDIHLDEKQFNVHLLHIDLSRNPFSKQNLKAYNQLCRIIVENKIDYIHCNTPVGGILGRFAGKKCKVKKVIYQAHGFHFYKGAPKLNWLVYYPIERLLAHWTDALITINQEDYQAAQNFKLRNNGHVYYVPGVGINLSEYENIHINRTAKRSTLGLSEKDFVLLSAGRLDYNKNNATIIKAVAKLNNPRVHFVLCGDGTERQTLSKLAETLKISDQIHFLGNRSDMKELYCIADVFVMASFREGLSRSIMEAMACGLPCIVSRIRGNVDLIQDSINGLLCEPGNFGDYADAITRLLENVDLRTTMSHENLIKIKDFDIIQVTEDMKRIYCATYNSKL